jgi:peptide deformylase
VLPFDLDAWLKSAESPHPIVQAGATVLRRRAITVHESLFGTDALVRLAAVMVETMRAAPGVGLAAPQIGVPLRVFVAEDREDRMSGVPADSLAIRGRKPLALTVVVNPTIAAASTESETFFEGCLSVRGYGALVCRATTVDLTGVDTGGRPVSLRLEGWASRIMQHEMDHLDGILYIDRMISRSLACDSELARWSALPVSDVLRDLVGS